MTPATATRTLQDTILVSLNGPMTLGELLAKVEQSTQGYTLTAIKTALLPLINTKKIKYSNDRKLSRVG